MSNIMSPLAQEANGGGRSLARGLEVCSTFNCCIAVSLLMSPSHASFMIPFRPRHSSCQGVVDCILHSGIGTLLFVPGMS